MSDFAEPVAKPPRGLRALAVVATLAASALLAAVVAFWGWRWLGPQPSLPPLAARSGPFAPEIVASHLFGRAAAPAARPASAAAAAAAASAGVEVRALGVLSGTDGRGEALLSVGGRPAALFRSGQEIQPGVVLRAVEPNAVVIVEAGVVRRIELRPPAPVAPGPPAPSPDRAGQALPSPGAVARATSAGTPADSRSRSDACAAAGRGDAYLLHAELLADMARQPQSWSGLLRSRGDALQVTDSSGFAAMLGLKAGDLLRRANGVALRSHDDVVAQVVRPLVAGAPVTVAGERDGRERSWLYSNAASCART